MAYLIKLPTYSDNRGDLTVVEKVLPFEIKRFYYIYNATEKRGGHRHHKTTQALICLNGSCEIYVNNNVKEELILLNSPDNCLILEPVDWHTMDKFTSGSVLLVFSSEYYDSNDYIDEQY
ncbi:MAG: FdtA/QdtA family cupin domain-containing protein [Leptospiraceae bacterium]|nr:FdtA/QdtA family cupin domain-containing protein [Leptospiraceae bacterium]